MNKCLSETSIRTRKMTLTNSLFFRSGTSNGDSKTWIFILHNSLLCVNDQNRYTPDLVKLRHPRSGGSAMFLFSHDNSVVQEVFSLSEKRSWFINDLVNESGKIYFSTPLDPLFLILPYLRKSKEEKRYVPLQDLLIDDIFPETLRVLKLLSSNDVYLVADRKGSEDLNAWVYNEEKTIKWLSKKTERVSQVLQDKQVNIGTNATSKNFVKSVKNISISDRKPYLKWAHGLVSEYLPNDLSIKLSVTLGLSEETSEKTSAPKRKCSIIETEKKLKKKKIDEETKAPKQEKTRNMSAKDKATLRAAGSSKLLTSFFISNK